MKNLIICILSCFVLVGCCWDMYYDESIIHRTPVIVEVVPATPPPIIRVPVIRQPIQQQPRQRWSSPEIFRQKLPVTKGLR